MAKRKDQFRKQRVATQKAKESRIQRNAHRMKNLGGVRLLDRADRLEEIKRRKEVK